MIRSWPKVVAIGGGTGLSTTLRSLKHFPLHLAGIVTMTDNGQSSGRLSRQVGTLPPGDVRKCLTALATDETLLSKLFEYRFKDIKGLNGHSLGNLLLLALTDITGNFEKAIEASSRILSVKGRVIPTSLEPANIIAMLNNGQTALGEKDIPVMGHRYGVKKVMLVPDKIKPNPAALDMICQADLVLVGPGSFYTSLVPNFLIKEIRHAVEDCPGKKVFILNCSTERGETEGYTVEKHVEELGHYVSMKSFDAILVNNKVVKESPENGLGNINNITTKKTEILGVPVISTDLISDDEPLYHDPKKLGEAIWKILTDSEKVSVESKDSVAVSN